MQRWGAHPSYANSLSALVSVNGYLSPDPQLRAILHSAAQLFESAPAARPDIPVAFWSRFLFSDQYLDRVPKPLALNMYTAVSNPISPAGRTKVARGALQHRDLRGGLAPDLQERTIVATVSEVAGVGAAGAAGAAGADAGAAQPASVTSVLTLVPVRVPVIAVQSTENLLVNPSHVDSLLVGRPAAQHLFSHELAAVAGGPGTGSRPVTGAATAAAAEKTVWVGKRASGPGDYPRCSTLGARGLRMLLTAAHDPCGAFVLWARAGHCVQQEAKTVLLDLFDALARPSEDHVGDVWFGVDDVEDVAVNAATKVKVGARAEAECATAFIE